MRTRPTDQLEIIYQLTKPLDLAVQHRSLYKHSAEGEVRHTGKSSMGTDLWSLNMISAEQNTMKDQENSMHASEVCEYSIILVQ